MLELPRGLWRWLAENAKDLGRIAAALETIAHEATAIREALQEQDDDQKEEQR